MSGKTSYEPIHYTDADLAELQMIKRGSGLLLASTLDYYHRCGRRWGCDWADAGAWLNNPVGKRPGRKGVK